MRADKICAVLFWAALVSFWSMSVWGGWAERAYARSCDSSPKWFWLRFFGIPRTRSNCVRFLKSVSLFGMGLVTVMLAVILVWGQ